MTAKLSTISLLAVGMLIGVQVFTTPPATYKIERYSDDGANGTMQTASPMAANSPAPREPERVAVDEPF